jgi:hypothetical protein
MDKTLAKICSLLESTEGIRRSAGAITLALLAPRDPGVVKALGEALATADPALAGRLLAALEAIGLPAAVPYVLPQLDAPEMENRLRAAAILAKAGSAVVPAVRARLEKATPEQKLMLCDLLARIHVRESFQVLLDLLFDPDFQVVKAVCDAVRRHMTAATPAVRAALHKQLVQFMASPRVRALERAQTSGLLLLGAVGQPAARTLLLKYVDPKKSPYLRRHALVGLKSLELSGAAAAAVARAVWPCLDEDDEALVRVALDMLDKLQWPGMTAAAWAKLLGSRHAPVRAAVARNLAGTDTLPANRELLQLLGHEDTEVREIAAAALSSHTGATRILLDAMKRATGTDAAWRLAKILKAHSAAVDAKTRKEITTLAAAELQKGTARREALLFVLGNLDPKAAHAVVRAHGLKLRGAQQWADGVQWLLRLLHTEAFDDEARYALSICNLKLSSKDLAPQWRAQDHALRGLHSLLRGKTFKLFARLCKEKSLEPADLFYVGAHFSEMPGEERALGEQVLQHVAKTWPRTAEGRSAKSRMKAAG